MSPFLAARYCVAALLGPADYERPRAVGPGGVLCALARWGCKGGVSLAVIDGEDDLIPTLRAERPNGDFREWQSIGDGTVRDACAWLGWTVPRVTLPGLAPPVGYDADGRLATDDGGGVAFNDLPDDAA